MKLLIFRIATFILFLAVKPGINLLSLRAYTEQTCCGRQYTQASGNDKSQEQNQDNNSEGKSCNPFQLCSSCILVCLNIPFISIPKPTVFSDEKFTYQSTVTSHFTPGIWQTPKIV